MGLDVRRLIVSIVVVALGAGACGRSESPANEGRTVTIYVSTLSRSGVAALVWSFASVAGTIAFVLLLLDAAERLVIRPLVVSGHRLAYSGDLAPVAVYGIGAGLVGVLLILGFVNHCSMERGASRTWQQALGIASYIVAGVAVFLTVTL